MEEFPPPGGPGRPPAPTFGPPVDERVRAACRRAGTRFHAAGEHPGFMFERLATTRTALSQRVDRIIGREIVDCRGVAGREMLVDLMGMGRQPEQINTKSTMFQAVSIQYEQALAATADVLGLRFDEIRPSIDTVTTPHEVELPAATLPAGSVVGQLLVRVTVEGAPPGMVTAAIFGAYQWPPD
ncbi:hypothetical protein [Frankia sp. AgKG'84/4]|uniref:hypothetical protein n=1 Tax=Frankia sp. AgKG'84/4 TaxID=573490 RepID=UPI0020104D3A|nr:hypothetical protein [Frankia sp. AgKG'84/4]MCL9795486.1 hypothetical protein [Frankia sp. AgKG'84/4]